MHVRVDEAGPFRREVAAARAREPTIKLRTVARVEQHVDAGAVVAVLEVLDTAKIMGSACRQELTK